MRRPRQPTVFRERVYEILRRVPRGKVVTYGQLALMAGRPRAAREVGWIAHAGLPGLPWQRVVNRLGGLASGYRDGRRGHKQDLEREGVRVGEDFTVDLARYQWWPRDNALRRVTIGHEIRSSLDVRTRRRRVPGPRPARQRRSGQRP